MTLSLCVLFPGAVSAAAETPVSIASLRAQGRTVTLSTPGRDAQNPAVAMNRRGDAVVAWGEESDAGSRVMAARSRAGGPFSRPQVVSLPRQDDFSVRTSIGPRGTAAVTWVSHLPRLRGGGPIRLYVSIAEPDRRFGQPRALSAPTESADEGATLAFDGFENLVVAWPGTLADASMLRVAFRRPRRAFQAAKTVFRSGRRTIGVPSVAFDQGGTATIVWDQGGDDLSAASSRRGTPRARPSPRRAIPDQVKALTRTASGRYGRTRTLSLPRRNCGDSSLAQAPSGAAVVTFTCRDVPHFFVEASLRPAAGDFGVPLKVGGLGGFAPSVGIEDAGQALVVWLERRHRRSRLQLASIPPLSQPTEARTVAAKVDESVDPAVVVDPSGTSLIAWIRGDHRLLATIRDPAGAISQPFTLAKGARVSGYDVQADGEGNVVLAWRANRRQGGRIRATRLSIRGD